MYFVIPLNKATIFIKTVHKLIMQLIIMINYK